MWIACVLLSIVRVSVGANGEEPNGASETAQISADGRHVLFSSYASNLVRGDLNHYLDTFLRDLDAGTTECLTCELDSGGNLAVAISPNGRYVTYNNALPEYCVLDRWTGIRRHLGSWGGDESSSVAAGTDAQFGTVLISDNRTGRLVESIPMPAPGTVVSIKLSRTGRFVGCLLYFTQSAPASYVFDRETGATEQVDDGSGGRTGPLVISADGRFVAYETTTSVVLYDRRLGVMTRYPPGGGVAMTPDARFVAWTDFHGRIQIVDRSTGAIQAGPYGHDLSISDDGSRIAFNSDAPLDRHDTNGLSDVYVWIR